MRSKSAFRQRDVTRAIKAVRASGVDARIEITDGRFTPLLPVLGEKVSDLQGKLADFEARHGQA